MLIDGVILFTKCAWVCSRKKSIIFTCLRVKFLFCSLSRARGQKIHSINIKYFVLYAPSCVTQYLLRRKKVKNWTKRLATCLISFHGAHLNPDHLFSWLKKDKKSSVLCVLNHTVYFYLFNFRRIESIRIRSFIFKPTTMWFSRFHASKKNICWYQIQHNSTHADIAKSGVNIRQCFKCIYSIAAHWIVSFYRAFWLNSNICWLLFSWLRANQPSFDIILSIICSLVCRLVHSLWCDFLYP